MSDNEQEARWLAVDYYLRLSDALTLAGDVASEGDVDVALASALYEQAMQAWECTQIAAEGLVARHG